MRQIVMEMIVAYMINIITNFAFANSKKAIWGGTYDTRERFSMLFSNSNSTVGAGVHIKTGYGNSMVSDKDVNRPVNAQGNTNYINYRLQQIVDFVYILK